MPERTVNQQSLMFFESLPDLLIAERKRLALSQKELAVLAGVSGQQIQRYESSRYQTASYKRMLQIARALASVNP